MIVLGIDPGSIRTGYGVIDWDTKGHEGLVLGHGTIRPTLTEEFTPRLGEIYEGVTEIIQGFLPALNVCAIEMPVYAQNAQTMLKLGRAQAAAMLAAHHQGLRVFEYTPKSVKMAVTGNGSATKEQVAFMIRSLLQIRGDVLGKDASDALAVAVCHCNHRKIEKSGQGGWGDFVRQNPGRTY